MGSDSKAIPSDWEIITIYNNALVLVKKINNKKTSIQNDELWAKPFWWSIVSFTGNRAFKQALFDLTVSVWAIRLENFSGTG